MLRPGLLLPGAPGDAARPVGRGRAAFQRRAGAERQDGGTALGGAHQHDYACMLLRRHPGDQAKAQALLALALATAQELGMTSLQAQVHRLQSPVPGAASRRQERAASPLPLRRTPHLTQDAPAHVASLAAPVVQNIFRHEGAYWTLAYQGSCVGSKRPRVSTTSRRSCAPLDGNSMSPIWQRSPHPAALWGAPSHSVPRHLPRSICVSPGQGCRGAAGCPGRAAYTQRLEDLQAVLDEAERFNDPARAATARAEIDFLTAQARHRLWAGRRPAKVRIPMRRCARP